MELASPSMGLDNFNHGWRNRGPWRGAALSVLTTGVRFVACDHLWFATRLPTAAVS